MEDFIVRSILWCIAAWNTFLAWVETQPAPDVQGVIDSLVWLVVALLVLSAGLIAFLILTYRAARPYEIEQSRREAENRVLNEKIEADRRQRVIDTHTPEVVELIRSGMLEDWQ